MTGSKTQMFVLTDANSNNNKFWEISMDEAGVVSTRNGRVGSNGQTRKLGMGEGLYQSKLREKERKGYREVQVVSAGTGKQDAVKGTALMQAVEDQIGRGNQVITDLVRELAKINKHQILQASGGQMDLDLSTGIISTPVGVVTAVNVAKARKILEQFERFVTTSDFDNPSFVSPLEEYLMLVPQKVGSKRGWHRQFITGVDSLVQQNSLLDQLESSIEIAQQRVADAVTRGIGDKPVEQLFDVQMDISTDAALRARIEAFYQKGRQRMHASHNFKISRIFDVTLGNMARDYEADGRKVGGEMELWHGTRAHNLISILKSGLIIPKSNGSIHVTGRMFGDGLYFSDQSTKSLNYSYGYWDGGRRDSRCYMFLADVAMGKHQHPTRTGSSLKPSAGFDSIYARGGQDIVANNEMIVYRTGQANLKYLIEFEM